MYARRCSEDPSSSWTEALTWPRIPVSPVAGAWRHDLPRPQPYSSHRCRSSSPSSHQHPCSGWLRHSPSRGPGSLCSPHRLPQRVSRAHTDGSLGEPRSLQQVVRVALCLPCPSKSRHGWCSRPQRHGQLPGRFTCVPAHPACHLLVLAHSLAHPPLLRVLCCGHMGPLEAWQGRR